MAKYIKVGNFHLLEELTKYKTIDQLKELFREVPEYLLAGLATAKKEGKKEVKGAE